MHIVHRGNNRARVFLAEHDYRFYLSNLAELTPSHQCAVHAFVLMPNHVHLLLTPHEEQSASKLMKHLAQRHAQFINKFNRRTGSLWEGRFHSSVVEDSNYLFNCYRYIELNPVRASLASHPSEYEWSSYRNNAEGLSNYLITPHKQFIALAENEHDRRSAYRAMFGSALDDRIVNEIRGTGRARVSLGTPAFRLQWARGLAAGPSGSDPGVRPGGRTPG
jgi:putative transposase